MTSTAPFTRLSSSLMPNETAICGPTIELLLSGRVLGVHDARQRRKLVKRRGRRQSPFERRRTLAPGIGAGRHLAHERRDHAADEHEQADGKDISADRGHEIPARE